MEYTKMNPVICLIISKKVCSFTFYYSIKVKNVLREMINKQICKLPDVIGQISAREEKTPVSELTG